MVVEWLRSCYTSSWRVWSDSNQLVKGRYYRVRHDARGIPLVPCYPKPHIYGSAVWHDTNFRLVQPDLGEVIISQRVWNNGAPPVRRPDPITVGSPACLESGELLELGLPVNDGRRFQSWPTACGFSDPIDIWGEWADVYRCEVQRFWCDRQYELGKPDIAKLQAELQAIFADAQFHYHPQEGLFPAAFTLVHADYAIAGINPTQTAEQALVELMQGAFPPVNQGVYSTLPLWQQQAQRVVNFLDDDGVDATKPILFLGHSYGGAAAQIAAAICRVAHRGRIIRWLTFGAPRIGDERLKKLAGLPTRGCSLVNEGDLIGAIPPNLADALPLADLLLLPVLPWALWLAPNEVWILHEDGSVSPNANPDLSTQDLFDFIMHCINTGTFFGIPAHRIDSYILRLYKRCPPALFADGNVEFAGPRGGMALRNVVMDQGAIALHAMRPPRLAFTPLGLSKLALGVNRGALALRATSLEPMPAGRVVLAADAGRPAVELRTPAAIGGRLSMSLQFDGNLSLSSTPAGTGSVELTGGRVGAGSLILAADDVLPFAAGRVALEGRPAAIDAGKVALVNPLPVRGGLTFVNPLEAAQLGLFGALPAGLLALLGTFPRAAEGRVVLAAVDLADGSLILRDAVSPPTPRTPLGTAKDESPTATTITLPNITVPADGMMYVAVGQVVGTGSSIVFSYPTIAWGSATFNSNGSALLGSFLGCIFTKCANVTAGTHDLVITNFGTDKAALFVFASVITGVTEPNSLAASANGNSSSPAVSVGLFPSGQTYANAACLMLSTGGTFSGDLAQGQSITGTVGSTSVNLADGWAFRDSPVNAAISGAPSGLWGITCACYD